MLVVHSSGHGSMLPSRSKSIIQIYPSDLITHSQAQILTYLCSIPLDVVPQQVSRMIMILSYVCRIQVYKLMVFSLSVIYTSSLHIYQTPREGWTHNRIFIGYPLYGVSCYHCPQISTISMYMCISYQLHSQCQKHRLPMITIS